METNFKFFWEIIIKFFKDEIRIDLIEILDERDRGMWILVSPLNDGIYRLRIWFMSQRNLAPKKNNKYHGQNGPIFLPRGKGNQGLVNMYPILKS